MTPTPPATRNRLLARLATAEYVQVAPHLHRRPVHPQQVLFAPGVAENHVLFLEGGLCTIAQVTADGASAGIAIVGNEGAVGLTALGGDPESGQSIVVEVADGDAFALERGVFQRLMAAHSGFSTLIHRYAHAAVEMLMQSVACNALHPVEQRLARTLLDIRDRLGRDEIPVTQEALANMLGVRRATVTVAAAALHRDGCIEHRHGSTTIADAARLETASCECYRAVRRHFDRLLRQAV